MRFVPTIVGKRSLSLEPGRTIRLRLGSRAELWISSCQSLSVRTLWVLLILLVNETRVLALTTS